MNQQTQRVYEMAKGAARDATTVPYSVVAREIDLDMENPLDRNQLADMLDEISRTEHGLGRHMLSAVVVHMDDARPGDGFFKLAQEIGEFDGIDKETFYVEELKRVHEAWRGR